MTTPRDLVDRILADWAEVRPDLDASVIGVVGRVSRLSRLIDRHLNENFRRFGIEDWMYDVLATLRRQGAPYELTAGELVRHAMVTTGAITNRIDRLVARGLIERVTASDDRRKVIIRLTSAGLALVDEVVADHLDTERRLLAGISPRRQQELAATLRALLVSLGDTAD